MFLSLPRKRRARESASREKKEAARSFLNEGMLFSFPRLSIVARLAQLPTSSIEAGCKAWIASVGVGAWEGRTRKNGEAHIPKAKKKQKIQGLASMPAIVNFDAGVEIDASRPSKSKTPTHLPCTSRQSRSKALPVGERATPAAVAPRVPGRGGEPMINAAAAAASAAVTLLAAPVVVAAAVAVPAAPPPPVAPPPPPPPVPLSSAISPNPTGADGVSGVRSEAKNSEKGDACLFFFLVVVRWKRDGRKKGR